MQSPAPIPREIGNGLVLRTPANQEDVARVAAFTGMIHGPGIATLTTTLIAACPGMELADQVFVEDGQSGAVVSSLCLIPWRLRYGPASLLVGEMGIVGTDERYRGRGLVRAQVAWFMQRLAARGCVLSLIQGIPYYYRQFGYTYALPLGDGVRVNEDALPPRPAAPFTFRRAMLADVPLLEAFFAEAAKDLYIHAERSPEAWAYLLDALQGTELACEVWLVNDAQERPVGYVRLPDYHFGEELVVSEASRFQPDAAIAVLHQAEAWARKRGRPGVRLELPEESLLVQLARSYGAKDLGRYAWQVAMPDPAGFLAAIVPALEQRLAASGLYAWEGEMPINLYRSGALLTVRRGQVQVHAAAGTPHGAVSLPPDAFTPIALGWRSRGEVMRLFPDVRVDEAYRPLFDVLFPVAPGYLYAYS